MRTEAPLTTASPATVDVSDGRGPGRAVGVVGVRGGVGTSTVAAALGASDHGTDVASLPDRAAVVVVVTSPSVADTHRLLPVVEECHLRGAGPVVVAVVSDGHGRWPAASRARLRMNPHAVEVVAVPWVGRWRWRGAGDRASAGWVRAVNRLASATRPPDPGRIVVPRPVSRRERRRQRRRERRKDRS